MSRKRSLSISISRRITDAVALFTLVVLDTAAVVDDDSRPTNRLALPLPIRIWDCDIVVAAEGVCICMG